MSEENEFKIAWFHTVVLREIEDEDIQELEPNLYTIISDFLGKLKKEEYDNVEGKIKSELVNMISNLTTVLISARLDKALNSDPLNYTNLLDEEKFILDSAEELKERKEMILAATLNGRSKLLESVSQKHKTKSVVVRFLKEMDRMVGVDSEQYGPFKTEDVATIPYENAQALILKNIASKVRWED